eukprot:206184-Rhodomonas_salina.1
MGLGLKRVARGSRQWKARNLLFGPETCIHMSQVDDGLAAEHSLAKQRPVTHRNVDIFRVQHGNNGLHSAQAGCQWRVGAQNSTRSSSLAVQFMGTTKQPAEKNKTLSMRQCKVRETRPAPGHAL